MSTIRAFLLSVVSASIFASSAYACQCGNADRAELRKMEKLILKGRIKSVTVGETVNLQIEDGGYIARSRVDFEVIKAVKGKFTEPNVQIYTGTGRGDCGRMFEFMELSQFYTEKKRSVIDVGLNKITQNGNTYYITSICNYIGGGEYERAE